MKQVAICLALLVILALSCNLPAGVAETGGKKQQPESTQSVQASPISQKAEASVEASPTPSPTPEPTPTPTPIPSEPISIRQGLASLNSYQFTVHNRASGPTSQDKSETTIETSYSADKQASLIHSHTVSSSAKEPDVSTSDSTTYQIGNASCSGSEGDWEYDTQSPMQQEMADVSSQMLDIVPLIDDPTFVGSEEINGIMTHHFKFQVSGFGAQSGAEVTANQGEYWLAEDGQYIVKYVLILELRESPQGNAVREEFSMELKSSNQPVQIVMPAACK
jgi:hypothetical protein